MSDAIREMRTHMDRLRGRLFQAVEAVGFPEDRERAIKGVIRTTTYDAQADLEATLRDHADHP